MSAGCHVQAAAAQQGQAGQGTLLINADSSTDFDVTPPHNSQAGHRCNVSGSLQKLNSVGTWLSSGVDEWIDAFGSDEAGDYEAQMTTPTGSMGTLSGTFDTFLQLNVTREWTLTHTLGTDLTRIGTLTVREIANTSNSVTALMTFSCLNSPL